MVAYISVRELPVLFAGSVVHTFSSPQRSGTVAKKWGPSVVMIGRARSQRRCDMRMIAPFSHKTRSRSLTCYVWWHTIYLHTL